MDVHVNAKIDELVEADRRYHREAYLFVLEGLRFTQWQHKAPDGSVRHIDGRELCEGIRQLAEKSFGYLTKTVFAQWGVTRTEDFGEIVFSLAEAGLLKKLDTDSKRDFENAYDFDEVFQKTLIYD